MNRIIDRGLLRITANTTSNLVITVGELRNIIESGDQNYTDKSLFEMTPKTRHDLLVDRVYYGWMYADRKIMMKELDKNNLIEIV
jgi:hypothetical protein